MEPLSQKWVFIKQCEEHEAVSLKMRKLLWFILFFLSPLKNICFCLFPYPAVKDKLRWWIILSGYHWGVKITSKKPPNQNSLFPVWQCRKHPGKFLRKQKKTELVEERNLNHTGEFISSWSKTTVLGIRSTENWANSK